jgi:hypothetical protein
LLSALSTLTWVLLPAGHRVAAGAQAATRTADVKLAEVGEQWDEQEDRELIFEVAARTSPR